uniref:hypothetical protein n=1 Tax=Agathobacter sp. TaxID=2021311 RepID=UPI00405775B4
MSLEIERKFMIDRFPEHLEVLCSAYVEQGYVCAKPEVRIRHGIDEMTGRENYTLTIKGDGTLSRPEMETDVEKSFYEEVASFINKPMITKKYRCYAWEGHRLEVSLVDEGLESEFCYAEIEFSSEEEADAFIKPDFLGEEVTEDEDGKMITYWEKTRIW